MIAFLRRFSQVSRVRAGFGLLAVAVWATGFTSAGALNAHAPEMALAIGAAASIVGALGLIGGWLVSVSIKAPVDGPFRRDASCRGRPRNQDRVARPRRASGCATS
jgi:hypothetical protein